MANIPIVSVIVNATIITTYKHRAISKRFGGVVGLICQDTTRSHIVDTVCDVCQAAKYTFPCSVHVGSVVVFLTDFEEI